MQHLGYKLIKYGDFCSQSLVKLIVNGCIRVQNTLLCSRLKYSLNGLIKRRTNMKRQLRVVGQLIKLYTSTAISQ